MGWLDGWTFYPWDPKKPTIHEDPKLHEPDQQNIPELWEKLQQHRAHLERDGLLEERRRRHLAGEVFAVASSRAKQHLERAVHDDPELRRLLDAVQRRELDPLTAVREILEKVFHIHDGDSD